MKVRYINVKVIDCTADPHPVNYMDELLDVILDDILKVCKSGLVKCVRSVSATINGIPYESDHYASYSTTLDGKPAKLATGEFAQKHKIEGLYFSCDAFKYDDAETKAKGKHLPPGLTGVEQLFKEAKKLRSIDELLIGIIWTFADDYSCSDNIEYRCGECQEWEVNYSCQDWWVGIDGYKEWADSMAELLGREFPRSEDYDNSY